MDLAPTVSPEHRSTKRQRLRRTGVAVVLSTGAAVSLGFFAGGATPELDDGAAYPVLQSASRQGPVNTTSQPSLPPTTVTPLVPPSAPTTTGATPPTTTVAVPSTTAPTPTTTPSTTTTPITSTTTVPPATTTTSTTTTSTTTTAPPPVPTTPPTVATTVAPPTPTNPPPSNPSVVGGTLKVGDIADVGRNYAADDFLRTGLPTPRSTAHEPTGNFRMACEFSHFAYDDPIINPGQPGASHLHMFFGNTKADGNSTYASLRRTGESTCQGGALNRTAYWAPAVIDTAGNAVAPEFISVYYKGRGHGTDGSRVDVAEIPPGLRLVAGARPGDPNSESEHSWYCESGSGRGSTIPSCGSDELVGVTLQFPTCWDGVHLDTSDHRSHVVYPRGNSNTGRLECPTSHPVSLPAISLGIWFEHSGDSADWHLSSDRMPGAAQHANGSSFHSDWFGAWDTEVVTTWTQVCINGQLDCSWGDLGNGTGLSVNPEYTGPARITPPPAPATAQHAALQGASAQGVSTLSCVLYTA